MRDLLLVSKICCNLVSVLLYKWLLMPRLENRFSFSGSSSYTDSCINIITAIETMAFKSLLFFSLLSAAMVAAPVAEAQLGLIGGLLGLIRIQGTLFCTANGNMGANGTATPVFPNALVQLQCGGNVVSTSTTNGSGVFSILLDPLSYILSSLLTGCSLKVATPLASCDSTLPSLGGLLSSLQFIGNTTLGALLSVANIIPAGFRFVASN